jgi:hypothetical protein
MKRNLLLTVVAALAITPVAFGADASTLGVTVGPEASFTAVDATTTLTKGDTTFGAFVGTTNFTYKIRTTTSGGAGSITVGVTTFSGPALGPLVADLAYTCSGAASGTPCATSTAASTGTATSVAVFAADAHSADAGDAGATAWALADKPTARTGAYTSTATYTISAT